MTRPIRAHAREVSSLRRNAREGDFCARVFHWNRLNELEIYPQSREDEAGFIISSLAAVYSRLG